jgi:drug/metabolite transporter (DMT)-like permease
MKASLDLQTASPTTLELSQRSQKGSRASTAALAISSVIWGSSFLFGKLALQELTVSQLVLLRFAFGSLALFPIVVIKKAWMNWRDLPRFLLTGFLAVPATFLLQFHGLALTTVARASLIIGAIPPLLAVGGAVFLGERPGPRGWLVVATSMAGILVITGAPSAGGSWLGDGLVFLSTLVSVVWVMMNKRLSEKYSALVATTYMLLFGTLTLAPISLLWDGLPRLNLPATIWLSVLILGLLCTALAFVLWNWGLERVPASRAGVFLNLEPVVGVLLGVTVMGESLDARVVLGGLVILAAAWFAAQAERSSTNHDPEDNLTAGLAFGKDGHPLTQSRIMNALACPD